MLHIFWNYQINITAIQTNISVAYSHFDILRSGAKRNWRPPAVAVEDRPTRNKGDDPTIIPTTGKQENKLKAGAITRRLTVCEAKPAN